MRLVYLLFLISVSALSADVKGTTGQIKFDTQMDNQAEMTLNSTGLGIGIIPSTNLHVNGNALVSNQIFVGGSSGSSNLNVNGTIGFGFQAVTSSTTLSGNSIVLADTSSGNIVLSLPEASSHEGRKYTIKKTSTLNNLSIRDGGFIDHYSDLNLSQDYMGSLSVVSSAGNWHILNISGNGELLPSENLIGWWKLDEKTGVSATDSSITLNDGSLNNSTFSTNSALSNLNSGLYLDGINDYVTITYTSSYEIDFITLSIWVYPTSTGQNDQLFSKDNSGSNRSWQFRENNDGTVRFIVFDDDDSSNGQITSTNTLALNDWNHVAGTWDGSDIKLFINGQFDSSTSFSGLLNKDETNNAFLGRSENGDPGYFEGRLDDARIYNRALTEDEINTLFNQKP